MPQGEEIANIAGEASKFARADAAQPAKLTGALLIMD
jgi:hypothetical protein